MTYFTVKMDKMIERPIVGVHLHLKENIQGYREEHESNLFFDSQQNVS